MKAGSACSCRAGPPTRPWSALPATASWAHRRRQQQPPQSATRKARGPGAAMGGAGPGVGRRAGAVRPSRTRLSWDVGSETQGNLGVARRAGSFWGGARPWGRGHVGRGWWARPGRAAFGDLGGGSGKRGRDPGVVATPGPGSPHQQLHENFAG